MGCSNPTSVPLLGGCCPGERIGKRQVIFEQVRVGYHPWFIDGTVERGQFASARVQVDVWDPITGETAQFLSVRDTTDYDFGIPVTTYTPSLSRFNALAAGGATGVSRKIETYTPDKLTVEYYFTPPGLSEVLVGLEQNTLSAEKVDLVADTIAKLNTYSIDTVPLGQARSIQVSKDGVIDRLIVGSSLDMVLKIETWEPTEGRIETVAATQFPVNAFEPSPVTLRCLASRTRETGVGYYRTQKSWQRKTGPKIGPECVGNIFASAFTMEPEQLNVAAVYNEGTLKRFDVFLADPCAEP